MTLHEKWLAATQKSRLVIGIAPRLAMIPVEIARFDDPFLPFSRAIIEQTADLVCAYVLDLGAYLSCGAAGAVALERTIASIPRHLPIILHGPFVSANFVEAAFRSNFAVDAVTLADSRAELLQAYQTGAFVLGQKEDLAQNIGAWAKNRLSLGGQSAMWVTEEIIFASLMADFPSQVRQAAERYFASSQSE
jgi:hypothetical protein